MHKLYLVILFLYTPTYPFTVVLDPGHGGVFTGCKSSQGLKEKDLTLDIALRAQRILQSRKVQVILTRSTDTQLDTNLYKDLAARAAKARTAQAFISVHFNNAGRGYELYVPRTNRFPGSSYTLAGSIHHALCQNLDFLGTGSLGNVNAYDRGIRAANLHVLRNHTCPAVLIELDSLTNPVFESNLPSEAYKQKLAHTVCTGILAYVATQQP